MLAFASMTHAWLQRFTLYRWRKSAIMSGS
jgi:hypothetical protein